MDAVVLFFMLGVAAGLAKSDLKLPAALYVLILPLNPFMFSLSAA
jgi:hypothetical protein